jgi:chromosome partitioning related protein ParA
MMKTTVVSTKGGVGKTILTAKLGGILADLGQRVLLIDAEDIQPTLSSYYRLTQQAPRGLVDVLESGDTAESISTTDIGGDIVLSNDPEGKLPDWILHTPDDRFRLKRLLKRIEGYDFILIDTQGATGPLQDRVVLAADFLILPLPPELLSARKLARGTIGMIERLSHREDRGFPLGKLYGLIYRMDRTADARATIKALRAMCYSPSRGRIMILESVIPATVAYREGASLQQPAHRWEPTRHGPTPSGLESLLSLVRELPLSLPEAVLASRDLSARSVR